MSGYHLFEFEFYHLELQIREDDNMMDFAPFGNFDLLEASGTYINEYMEGQEWFTYTYDFGDDWSHRVTIEKVIKDYPYNYPCVIKYKDKPYYIPREDEIVNIAINGYLLQDERIDELFTLFANYNDVSPLDAEFLSTRIQKEISMGCELSDIFDILSEEGISFKNKKETQRFVDIFSNLWNNTRNIVNRGYTPNEMAEKINIFSGIQERKLPTVTAGSSREAHLLEAGKQEIEKLGFMVDLDSNTTSIPVLGMPNGIGGTIDYSSKKLYPNDPCPCGSGKKYKKCCGR